MFGMSKPAKPAKSKEATPAQGKAVKHQAKEEEEAVVEITVALTPARIQKLERLGGAGWIAAQIDKAKVPKGE